MLALCVLFAAVAPARAHAAERARFLFELEGIPVGTVELSVDDAAKSYRYTSTQVFTRGADVSRRVRTESFTLTEGPKFKDTDRVLESLWFWRGPWKVGCVAAESELEHQIARACITRLDPEGFAGTIADEPFQAEISSGRISELTIGRGRFVRVDERADVAAPPDLFGAGWTIAGAKKGALLLLDASGQRIATPEAKPLRDWPDRAQADALAAKVQRDLEPTDRTCLDFARQFVAEAKAAGEEAEVVHGLVAEPGAARAKPHAWVRLFVRGGAVELDPTLMIPVTPKTHLAVGIAGTDAPGRVWLGLVEGSLRVARR